MKFCNLNCILPSTNQYCEYWIDSAILAYNQKKFHTTYNIINNMRKSKSAKLKGGNMGKHSSGRKIRSNKGRKRRPYGSKKIPERRNTGSGVYSGLKSLFSSNQGYSDKIRSDWNKVCGKEFSPIAYSYVGDGGNGATGNVIRKGSASASESNKDQICKFLKQKESELN